MFKHQQSLKDTTKETRVATCVDVHQTRAEVNKAEKSSVKATRGKKLRWRKKQTDTLTLTLTDTPGVRQINFCETDLWSWSLYNTIVYKIKSVINYAMPTMHTLSKWSERERERDKIASLDWRKQFGASFQWLFIDKIIFELFAQKSCEIFR